MKFCLCSVCFEGGFAATLKDDFHFLFICKCYFFSNTLQSCILMHFSSHYFLLHPFLSLFLLLLHLQHFLKTVVKICPLVVFMHRITFALHLYSGWAHYLFDNFCIAVENKCDSDNFFCSAFEAFCYPLLF